MTVPSTGTHAALREASVSQIGSVATHKTRQQRNYPPLGGKSEGERLLPKSEADFVAQESTAPQTHVVSNLPSPEILNHLDNHCNLIAIHHPARSMRLIKTDSLTIEGFLSSDIPDYAILSHRWGNEEITLQEFQAGGASIKKKQGYLKIEALCRRAKADGHDYAWVDTCCIDKTSNTELSEAINSMYRWYFESVQCYAYLLDVNDIGDFERSEWFTRGWTLQELIAPEDVYFVDKDWKVFGTKAGLCTQISKCTGIPETVLTGSAEINSASVAQRMSWAARRKTTRREDAAYCLMGLFGLNMPLLYGEGENAFLRLQQEILKECDDQSILAWKSTDTRCGVLATSPAAFAECEDIVQRREIDHSTSPITVNSAGLHITLPFIGIGSHGTGVAVLGCAHEGARGDGKAIGMYLQDEDFLMRKFTRVRFDELREVEWSNYQLSQYPTRTLCIETKRLVLTRKTRHSLHTPNPVQSTIYSHAELVQKMQFSNQHALINAAKDGLLDDVWLLLARDDLLIDTVDDDGRTALSMAAERGHFAIVKTLVMRGSMLEIADKTHRTPLQFASAGGHEDVVQFLGERTARIDWADIYGETALHIASSSGRAPILRILMKLGAFTCVYSHDRRTPLFEAASKGYAAAVEALLEKGPKELGLDHDTIAVGLSPFTEVVSHGHNDVIIMLSRYIQREIAPEWAQQMHHDALHAAISNKSTEVIECLLAGGADASKLIFDGSCALSLAACKNDTDVMKILLRNGASVDQRDGWGKGNTPLGYATACESIQAMRLLLDNGADINATDSTGRSPFLVAVKNQWVKGVQLLLDNGADVNVADKEGMTAWRMITAPNVIASVEMIELLVCYNASLISKDAAGQTPLDLGKQYQDDKLSQLLLPLKL